MGPPSSKLAAEVVEGLPYGIVIVDAEGTVRGSNGAADAWLPQLAQDPLSCADLFSCRDPGGPCESGCLAQRAAATGKPLPEIRIDTAQTGDVSALWVTAAPLREEGRAVLHLRLGDANDRRRRSSPHWISGPQLRIGAFGRTRVDSAEGPMSGKWIQQRPGEVLKYLVCERNRVVHAEEIAESLWPGAGRQGPGRVRHFIHGLREQLEPGRVKRAPSHFIVNVRGAYALDRRNVTIDADEFEAAVEKGLAHDERGENDQALASLDEALALLAGEFLADEPYAEWAYAERERLNGLAGKALRTVIRTRLDQADLPKAAERLEQLAELEPFDSDVQRRLLAVFVAQGRRTKAARRFAGFRMRMLREFGEEPEFSLSDL
ncbi:MAG: winged helix-turn-helix domain-containing protein [Thermoleophilaceae bacterium]|nr:winged helix-turn-helix domain-containing protein [Thermoleophilaceae bacterium]